MTVELWFKKVLAAGSAIAAVAIAASAVADVPAGITQQGRLFDSAGDPVNGELQFTFSIYDASTAGNELWTDVQNITLDDGYFSTRLGEGTPFPGDLFDGNPIFLGVQIGADSEMTPRQSMSSVPYAHRAAVADSATTATSAISADTATSADSATTASNVTGDITPASVTVNAVPVISSTGTVPATALRGFASMFSRVQAQGTNSGLSVATANCPGGSIATGGSCAIENPSGDGTVTIKANEPTVSGGTPVGWTCSCQDADQDNNPTCTAQASVVCLTEG